MVDDGVAYRTVDKTNPAPSTVVEWLWNAWGGITETVVFNISGYHLRQPESLTRDDYDRFVHFLSPVTVQTDPVKIGYEPRPITTLHVRDPSVDQCPVGDVGPDWRLAHLGSWTPDGDLQYVKRISDVTASTYHSQHFPAADVRVSIECE